MSVPQGKFKRASIQDLANRANHRCSNPDCGVITTAPDGSDSLQTIGRAAHIKAASPGGPRYDRAQPSEKRCSAIDNGIWLCAACADLIDEHDGREFSVELLQQWRRDHENSVRQNLNRRPEDAPIVVDGELDAFGIGETIGVHTQRATVFRPGTSIRVGGIGNVTGVKIGGDG